MKRLMLVTALLLLGNLAMASYPGALISARNRGQQMESGNVLKQIGLAITMFVDSNDTMPASFSDITSYTGGGRIFVASFDKKSKAANGTIKPANTSFAYIGNVGRMPQNPAAVPIVFEKPWLLPENQQFINVLYADGHVARVNIPKVSSKSCKQIVEILTKDLNNASLKNKLLKNAEAEDKNK